MTDLPDTSATSDPPTSQQPGRETPVQWQRIEPWLHQWALRPDGEPIATHSSVLVPVICSEHKAMLKLALIPEEVRGARQLDWWNGNGAAKVLAIDGDAVLIERAAGGSLATMASGGRDEEAISIVCRVAAQLHRAAPPLELELVPLDIWFMPLLMGAAAGGGDFVMAADTARQLLETSDGEVSLHGDLHHHNVLDFGNGDWRAIDPKGLIGERTFDFVHVLRNPDPATSSAPGRLEARVAQIAEEAGISRGRLLAWAAAFSALSAIWLIEDEDCAERDMAMLRRCRALLSLAGPL